MRSASNRKAHRDDVIPPAYAWLTVFVPALAYFVGTRFHTGELGKPVANSILNTTMPTTTVPPQSALAAAIFPLSLVSKRTTSMMYLVQGNMSGIVDSTWKHEEELGRGYLLLSSAASNKIWRWEVGGGPIAIGRTLYMSESGCRSNVYRTCGTRSKRSIEDDGDDNFLDEPPIGSGGLAVDFSSQGNNPFEGKLTIAEFGEGRIVRMEESGARTPLLVQVPIPPSSSASQSIPPSSRRIGEPSSLIYTPFGDLLILENGIECFPTKKRNPAPAAAIYKLTSATKIPAVSSMWESRQAHRWSEVHHDHPVSLLYHHCGATFKSSSTTNPLPLTIGGMMIDETWTGLYVTLARHDKDSTVELVQLQLPTADEEDQDDDDESDEEDDDGNDKKDREIVPRRMNETVLLDLTPYTTVAGPMAADADGNLFVATDSGILIIRTRPPNNKKSKALSSSSANFQVVGILEVPTTSPSSPITSLTIGEDRYLYMTTHASLYRVRINHGPLKLPTNLIRK